MSSRAPSVAYTDSVLFELRGESLRNFESLRLNNDSNCVFYAKGLFASKEEWLICDLTGPDRRLKYMCQGLSIEHPLPIQRYCWPKLNDGKFPLVCIAPEGNGKTLTHSLFITAKVISSVPLNKTDEMISCATGYRWDSSQISTTPEGFVVGPPYIIVCSSHQVAETIARQIDKYKEYAYGFKATDSKRQMMPPVTRTINAHQEDHKLALRCHESDILIGAPAAIVKCLRLGYISLMGCKELIFDDIDLNLQLHNRCIRELMKIYIIQTEAVEDGKSRCHISLFARKWTDLLKQFLGSTLPQRILIFGSKVEASVYANVKFDIEVCNSNELKDRRLKNLIKFHLDTSKDKMAIVCCNDAEAEKLYLQLNDLGLPVVLYVDKEIDPGPKKQIANVKTPSVQAIFVISDAALELEVEFSISGRPLNDISSLVHFSMPDDMFTFDQRFRLMFRNISETNRGLLSTIFIDSDCHLKYLKRLYDVVARSSDTLASAKVELSKLVSNRASTICWRWASTGLCRLEKLSRIDHFGSFCPDKHSLNSSTVRGKNRWPSKGQIKITITHIVNPNEFYFRFEAHRDINNINWTKLDKTGAIHMEKMQVVLNEFRNVGTRTVPLSKMRKGSVFAIYFQQEVRVDRVMLLDEPKQGAPETINEELEYSKQIPVLKIDHGVILEVYVRNIIELPSKLASAKPQCHRAINLGCKPRDEEPNWSYKSKKHFYDLINVNNLHEITAWLRLNSDHCFWLENLTVSRQLRNIDSREICTHEPLRELCSAGLAEIVKTEPPCLQPSVRLKTISKWNSDALASVAQYAFLRQDRNLVSIYLLDVKQDFTVLVRLHENNRSLVRLEDSLKSDYVAGKLIKQAFFAREAYCLAKILHEENGQSSFSINRVKIVRPLEQSCDLESTEQLEETKYLVECLDHGDHQVVDRDNLYQATVEHLKILPFQAIRARMANINQEILNDYKLNREIRMLMFDCTRHPNEDFIQIRYKENEQRDLYLYIPEGGNTASLRPLANLIEQKKSQFRLHEIDDPEYQEPIIITATQAELDVQIGAELTGIVRYMIVSILVDIIESELVAVGVEPDPEDAIEASWSMSSSMADQFVE